MPQVAYSPVGNEQFFDNDGNPLAGGKLFFYTFGSFSIPRQTYTDYTAQVGNPFPIVLDSAGRPPDDIFISIFGKYNVTLTKPDGTTVLQTWTNISPVSGTSTINFQYADSVMYTGTGALITATDVSEALNILGNNLLSVKTITATSYQLLLSDGYNTLLRVNTTNDSTVTIPRDTTTNFPIGTTILITQIGNGYVTTTGSAGVTLLTPESNTIAAQYGKAVIIKTAPNQWEIEGDLEPS